MVRYVNAVLTFCFFSMTRLELKLKQMENELVKAKEQNVNFTNNNSKNEVTIKRLKKQLYMITWVIYTCIFHFQLGINYLF